MTTNIDKWRRGIPLSDAVWRFASARLRTESHSTRAKSARSQPETQLPTPAMSAPELSRNLLRLWQQALEPIRAQIEVRDEMRQSLLDRLSSGALIAYGFPAEDGVASDQPDDIPPFMLDLKFVDWANSSLKGLGREFVSVRVMRVERTKAKSSPSQAQPVSTIPPGKAVGRPSRRQEIREVLAALEAGGAPLAALGVKQLTDLVRKRIAERSGRPASGDLKGLSDNTIQRLYREWRAGKKL